MSTVGLKLSSWMYKRALKNCLRDQNGTGLVARKCERRVAPNASFIDGVASKDCIIDAITGVSIRIHLPEVGCGLNRAGSKGFCWLPESISNADESSESQFELKSFFETMEDRSTTSSSSSYDDDRSEDFLQSNGAYYPRKAQQAKLPVIVQFHDGAFVNGSKDTPSNDLFCRRIAKACKSVVIAVGYRLAPEHKFPSARDDGLSTLKWLARQANLATFSSDYSKKSSVGLIDSFAHMIPDPWITAHVDYSRCVVMGVGAGGSIAEQVTQMAMNMSMELEPLKLSAQVLICPLFSGVNLLPSEIILSDTYFIDRATLALIWKFVLPDGENHLDHPAVDPLLPSKMPALKKMPSTLVVSAELDLLRDRAAAYVGALQRVDVDANLLTYRNAVHGFVTLECLMNTRPAQACIEDIAIWFGRHVKQDWA